MHGRDSTIAYWLYTEPCTTVRISLRRSMSRKGSLLGFDCYVVQSALAGSDHKAAHIASTSRSWKKLSAFHYSRSEMIVSFDRWTSLSRDQLPINTILYTTAVINTPSRNESDIGMARDRLMGIAMNPIRVKAKEVLDAIRLRDEASRREILNRPGCHSSGGELEQIQFLLGHRSVETTERYLGSRQRLVQAVNDHLGIEPLESSS